MPDVTIKLGIGSFSVEVTGPADYAEKKLEELVGRYLGPARSGSAELQGAPVLEQGGKKLSAGEFLKKASHKNQTDRALVFGYYVERMTSQPRFTTTELGTLGLETKHPFSNISDAVARLVSRGLMMSSGEKENQRAYALTASGEEYVESMLERKP